MQRRIYTQPAPIDFAAIRRELDIPDDYPPAAAVDALQAASEPPWIDGSPGETRVDRTDLPFVTLDPPGSMDLDQAVVIERRDQGYLVHYAIADVGAWVRPGGALEAESFGRGETLYSPDRATPLHPVTLSEGAASLLPGQRRPAVLWTISLDEQGNPQGTDVRRAWITSVARLNYPSVQADLDRGVVNASIALLPEVGRLRRQLARDRHAITLDLPDVDVLQRADGHWRLELRAMSLIEQDNAEISLLTGMCAAAMMLAGGVGILRTLPDPDDRQIDELRRTTAALGIPWPTGTPPGEIIVELDPADPKQAAFLEHAVRLLRGAGYTSFDGAAPELTEHAGVGAPYAHVTAPLRRLVDRFGTEICLSLHADRPVPDWVRSRLEQLPGLMAAADRRASTLEKACIGAVGAFLLAGREGENFTATVLQIDRDRDQALLVLSDPPVRAKCGSDGLHEGAVVVVTLVSANPATHTYRVVLVGSAPPG